MNIDKKAWQYIGLIALAIVTVALVGLALTYAPSGQPFVIPNFSSKKH